MRIKENFGFMSPPLIWLQSLLAQLLFITFIFKCIIWFWTIVWSCSNEIHLILKISILSVAWEHKTHYADEELIYSHLSLSSLLLAGSACTPSWEVWSPLWQPYYPTVTHGRYENLQCLQSLVNTLYAFLQMCGHTSSCELW